MAKKTPAPKSSKILWVEGRWTGGKSFVPALLNKGFDIDSVPTGRAALQSVNKDEFDLFVVNAASMRTSGKRICQTLRERINGLPLILIADPQRPVAKKDQCANVVLSPPFTSRKLINRLHSLMPGETKDLVKAGPLELDLGRNQVKAGNKKTKLTPRLVRLLHMLIDRKGEVVEREELFKKVWRTDYTGDTRTLDVHISWLRQAIEKDAHSPQILKTHRGVGYILNV